MGAVCTVLGIMNAIELHNVSIDYYLDNEDAYSFKNALLNFYAKAKKPMAKTFRALNNLSFSVETGEKVGIIGLNGSGKTTLLNALISATPIHERVITIEEVFELKPTLPDLVALQTRSENLQGEGAIPLRRLIKEALRMRPSRIVIGEVREAEALDLLIALNSGLPGMGTLHANSARDAITKLQTLPLLAGENISHKLNQ
jgi:pilus assembly protein CpaF